LTINYARQLPPGQHEGALLLAESALISRYVRIVFNWRNREPGERPYPNL
jgi:hypothetical protein